MSWRRLGVLIEHLPRESATVRSVRGEAAEWMPGDYILALIADLVAAGNWQRSQNPRLPRPKPIPRPGQKADDGNRIGTPIPLPEMKKLAERWMRGGLPGTTREAVEVT